MTTLSHAGSPRSRSGIASSVRLAVSHGEYSQWRQVLDDVGSEEGRRSENHGAAAILDVAGAHDEIGLLAPDGSHDFAWPHEAADARQQLLDDPAVSFGPGQRSLLVAFTRREILQPGPRRHVGGARAVVVAADVVRIPKQRF